MQGHKDKNWELGSSFVGGEIVSWKAVTLKGALQLLKDKQQKMAV